MGLIVRAPPPLCGHSYWSAARTFSRAARRAGRTAAPIPATTAIREHARVLVDLGAALRRSNSRSEARKHLREALELAEWCGATSLYEQANNELAATGAHRRTVMLRGIGALTASEQRVAKMAAAGASNKEIAQGLFVTVKTVEMHLSRVYRKLELSSRAQLAGALDQSQELAGSTM